MPEPVAAVKSTEPPGVVGPNAVIQLARALMDGPGPETARRIFEAAGYASLLKEPPSAMIDERIPARLFEALWRELPDAAARRVSEDAGRRTGYYILENRIPGFAKRLFRILPAPIALRLLTVAIGKNAWTFVGSGVCRTRLSNPALIEITGNPLPMPDCVWHQAVFGALFGALVLGAVQVRHVQCREGGSVISRFELALATTRVRATWARSGDPARPAGDGA